MLVCLINLVMCVTAHHRTDCGTVMDHPWTFAACPSVTDSAFLTDARSDSCTCLTRMSGVNVALSPWSILPKPGGVSIKIVNAKGVFKQ